MYKNSDGRRIIVKRVEWGIERSLKTLLWSGAVISTSIQMLLFSSIGVFALCMMQCVVCYFYCKLFLKRDLFLRYPFSSVVFISIFLYRYLPPLATLSDGNPVTIGLVYPVRVAILETLAFISFALAFYCAIRYQKRNVLRSYLIKFGLFKPQPPLVYWILGGIGVYGSVFTMLNFGGVEMGDVGGKFVQGLAYLRFVPIVMLVPSLFGLDARKMPSKVYVVVWIVFLIILGIASNGRKNMIMAVVVFALMLMFVYFVRGGYLTQMVNPIKMLFVLLLAYVGIGFMGDMSLAMLNTRKIRADVRGKDLLSATLDVYFDDKKMAKLKAEKETEESDITSYDEGWTEDYVSSHFLNRYCNIRITDETLWLADKIVADGKMGHMQAAFVQNMVKQLPTPIINFFGISLDKSSILYSNGDYMYAIATNKPIRVGYRVSSHVSDGLATFGYFTFLVFFVVYFIDFYFINSFSICKGGMSQLSVLGGAYLANFMNFFGNGGGIIKEVNFILRTYWQTVILYLLFVFIITYILRTFRLIK